MLDCGGNFSFYKRSSLLHNAAAVQLFIGQAIDLK